MMLLYLEKMERTRKYLDEDLEDEKIRQDVEQFVTRCTICQKAKSRLNPQFIYASSCSFFGRIFLEILFWDYLGVKRGGILFFIVVDRFSKMTHFIPYHKSDDVVHIANSFSNRLFAYMVCHLVSDRNASFVVLLHSCLCDVIRRQGAFLARSTGRSSELRDDMVFHCGLGS